jgi:hypothetical protein
VTPFFSGGLAAAFRVKGRASLSSDEFEVSGDCEDSEEQIDNPVKAFDPGLVGAIGVDIRSLRITVGYFRSLSSIDDVNGAVAPARQTLRRTRAAPSRVAARVACGGQPPRPDVRCRGFPRFPVRTVCAPA